MRALNAVISPSHRCRWVFALLLLICAGFAQAQSDDTQDNAGDPPARVARVSYAAGDLGLMPAGSTEWSAADVNRPLTNGDKLSTAPGARAELELGGAALRIDGESDIGVLNLNDQTGQFELTQGTLNLTVRNIDQGSSYEIDTPTVALVIDQPGNFRVAVSGDDITTTVSVFDGNGIVYGENNAQRDAYSGRSYQFSDSSLANVMVSDIEGGDAFDAWCNDRNAHDANDETATAQYVSDDVVGGQDLDAYGSWQDDGDYGAVWYPANVAAGWAPYRFGHWVWIGPWGWTWVDNSPWGFAPYHYGRWAFIRGAWGWMPGPRRGRPIYAPALVAFVGIGAGGPVGWFPLGPHEIYNPWYRASRNYYTNVNVTNIAIRNGYTRDALINNIHHQYGFYQTGRPAPGMTYVNRSAPHAFTAVSAQAFAGARNVQASQVHMSPQQVAAASVMAPAALQRPTSASFGQPRVANARPLPAAGFNRQVVAVGRPSAVVATNASFHAGQPTSNIRVLGPRAGIVANPPRVVNQENVARPAQAGANVRPATLPQVPRFAPAQQVRQVEQPQRYTPQQPYAQPRENAESEQRYDAAQRAHEYVPEQQRQAEQPHPYQQPYRYEPNPQQYEHPPQQGEQQHPQNAPKPREAAPPPRRNDNQH